MPDFKLEEWVAGLGLEGDAAKAVIGAFAAEKVQTSLKSQVMAQSDYSRAMDKLRADETKLKADLDKKLADEMSSLSQYRGEYDGRYQKALKERLDAENALASMRTQIEAVASEYALPDEALKPILGKPAATTATTTTTNVNDPAKLDDRYLTKENFGKEAFAYQRLPIEYMRIAAEHQSLFKTDPYLGDKSGQCIMDKVLERSLAEKVSLRAAWEREFNVGAKREELREADVASRIEAATKAAETRIRSELALENPGVRTTTLKLPGSPALAAAGPMRRDSDPTNANEPAFKRAHAAGSHEDRVRAAVAAFHTNLEAATSSGGN